ncbi:GNAT family N-acetyltransferase [Vulgatibacter incomptus]|nr:GNAT family N-acetyltransferase [Vulgatibacter incomptus]
MSLILETDRLVLRELEASDARQLRLLNENLNVYRYTGDGPLADDEEASAILRDRIFPQYRLHGVGRWAVEQKADGSFIGWCGFKFMPETGVYDLGYRFFEAFWGRGLGTEAAAACMTWFSKRFPGKLVEGRSRIENLGSIRILEKVGLQRVGEENDLDGRVFVYRARV